MSISSGIIDKSYFIYNLFWVHAQTYATKRGWNYITSRGDESQHPLFSEPERFLPTTTTNCLLQCAGYLKTLTLMKNKKVVKFISTKVQQLPSSPPQSEASTGSIVRLRLLKARAKDGGLGKIISSKFSSDTTPSEIKPKIIISLPTIDYSSSSSVLRSSLVQQTTIRHDDSLISSQK